MQILRHLLDLVFGLPELCSICQRPLPLGQVKICSACQERIPLVEGPVCRKCGKPMRGAGGNSELCYDCRQESRYFTRARSLGIYTGALRTYIHQLKYGRQRRIAEGLGYMMGRLAGSDADFRRCDVVVPVPLHKQRLRERGFNQAELLARVVAHCLCMPLPVDTCTRLKPTVRQSNLGLRERGKNIRGAFAVRAPGLIRGKRVLVIDDIFTTGATVNELSRCLLRAGAEYVFVLTAATGATDRDLAGESKEGGGPWLCES